MPWQSRYFPRTPPSDESKRMKRGERHSMFSLGELNCVCEYFQEMLFTFLCSVFQENIASWNLKGE